MRYKLEENAITKTQNPRSQHGQLVITRQRSHLPLKLSRNFSGPRISHKRGSIQHAPVTLTNNRQRLKHIVKNDSRRKDCNQRAPCRIEAAINAHWRVPRSLAVSDPLL